MDEAHKRGMTISECILFSLEDYWDIIENGRKTDAKEYNKIVFELENTENELAMANRKLERLRVEKEELLQQHALATKSIWQEANETAERLSKERITQERAIAVREYIEENFSRTVNTDQEKLQWYANRLSLYETDTLKKVFQAVRQNTNIKDLPDVVQALVKQYYQQFLSNHQYVQIQ
ncbi:hypothetical protein GCM10011514_41820 [Emticicia aquatilis]|uniref:Uncharacterized protein n=1 Tax=Emticicia aquatilis TaxID=1537369 RepID=A0A917DW64_9BACT|nr:hypothetical protein [Emticicia aquatilis]GGD73398.1 hypothetical protein GCM10011514_41820 [Emticicia aquatilis]